jgi:hypothetical protein
MYSHRGCSFSLSVVEVLGCFMSMLFNESVAVRKVAGLWISRFRQYHN